MTLPLRVYGRLCPGLKIIQIQTLLLLRSKITSMNIIMKNLIWQISPRNSGLIIIIFLRILISIFQKGSADIWIRCGLKNPAIFWLKQKCLFQISVQRWDIPITGTSAGYSGSWWGRRHVSTGTGKTQVVSEMKNKCNTLFFKIIIVVLGAVSYTHLTLPTKA